MFSLVDLFALLSGTDVDGVAIHGLRSSASEFAIIKCRRCGTHMRTVTFDDDVAETKFNLSSDIKPGLCCVCGRDNVIHIDHMFSVILKELGDVAIVVGGREVDVCVAILSVETRANGKFNRLLPGNDYQSVDEFITHVTNDLQLLSVEDAVTSCPLFITDYEANPCDRRDLLWGVASTLQAWVEHNYSIDLVDWGVAKAIMGKLREVSHEAVVNFKSSLLSKLGTDLEHRIFSEFGEYIFAAMRENGVVSSGAIAFIEQGNFGFMSRWPLVKYAHFANRPDLVEKLLGAK